MIPSQLTLTVGNSKNAMTQLADRYFYIQELNTTYPGSNTVKDTALLDSLLLPISEETPLEKWEKPLLDQFISFAADLTQRAMHAQKGPDPTTTVELAGMAEWLCNLLVAIGTTLDYSARTTVWRLWATLRVTTSDTRQDIDSMVSAIVTELTPVSDSNDALQANVRAAAIASMVAQADGTLDDSSVHATLKEWCSEILRTRPELIGILTPALQQLGVTSPGSASEPVCEAPPPASDSSEKTANSQQQSVQAPIWVVPDLPSATVRSAGVPRLILKLRALVSSQSSPFSDSVKSQLRSLTPGSDSRERNRTFSRAASELWKRYWTAGDREALELASRLGEFLLGDAIDGRVEAEIYNALWLWMRTQAPVLIQTAEIPALSTDGIRLFTEYSPTWGVRAREARVLEALVLAHAGEAQRLSSLGDDEAKARLLSDNSEDLRHVHETLVRLRQAANRADFASDELEAWDLLYANQASESVSDPNAGGGLLSDPAFQEVIKRGVHENVWSYIEARHDTLKRRLEDRLEVKLSADYVVIPEGIVFNPRATKRGQQNTRFAQGTAALQQQDYARAGRLFEQLSEEVGEGYPRNVSLNYLAYALAKQGDLLQARTYLFDLAEARVTFSSAYWNLACCLPAEQVDQRLERLAIGLQAAPHPRLLRAATLVGLYLDDERLRDWLPCLTYIEALLLSFYMSFDSLDTDARERAVLRIGQYAREGEPADVDPTKKSLGTAGSQFVTQLLDRNHDEAVQFWLRCREVIAKNRYDYWELRADYLERRGHRSEALQAFREEMRKRVSFVEKRPDIARVQGRDIRARLGRWLPNCMTPELRLIGQDIYKLALRFEALTNNSINVMPLGPIGSRVKEYFRTSEVGEGSRSSAVDRQRSSASESARPILVTLDLESALARAGAQASAQLHEARDTERVAADLAQLRASLQASGKTRSADALNSLVDQWNSMSTSGVGSRDSRLLSLQRSQSCFATLTGALQSDLSEGQLTMANSLLRAFERVNARIARALELLPNLLVEPVEGGMSIDRTTGTGCFSVRVRSDDPGQARIVGATARGMDPLLNFALRNRLGDLALTVGAGVASILSFQVTEPVRSDDFDVSIEVSFEHAGGVYETAPITVRVSITDLSELPSRPPYISGRALLPEEIDTHFFGREEEEEVLLGSVSDGQQSWRYVEGIRKVGKSSLLSSLIQRITNSGLAMIPVYISAANASANDAGRLLFNLLDEIARCDAVRAAGVEAPDEGRLVENPTAGYREFVEDLKVKLPNYRVLALLDDFQALVEAANAAQEHNPGLREGIVRIFDVIRFHGTPAARLTWLFTGHRAARDYRSLLPGVLLWGELRPVAIDFLSSSAVERILTVPLKSTPVVCPVETCARVHALTGGHPDVVQQMGELMYHTLRAERRSVMTPADADDAARDIALYTDVFADTWYPVAQLSRDQKELIGAFTNAVPLGGRIAARRLVPSQELTEHWKKQIEDLISRRILDSTSDGTIGIRSHVLELWLREKVPSSITDAVNGSIAIFIDVANLTAGSGRSSVSGLDTSLGEDGIVGTFRLGTIIDRIEAYAKTLSPAPVADKWVVNYPLKSAAVLECNAKGYKVENIPEDLWEKGQEERGADDVVLNEKVTDVQRYYPTVNQYVLVSGDKGYRIKVERLLREGKYVCIIARSRSIAHSYDRLAASHPERLTVLSLEDVLERN